MNLLTLFALSFAAYGADDTFACFAEFPGPVVKTFSGEQGYVNYTLMDWTDYARIDARGATFRQEHLAGGGTMPKRPWLVVLGGNWKNRPRGSICWVGGRFIGSTPLHAGYRAVKRNAGEAISINSDGGIIDGVRIHNIHEDSLGTVFGKNAGRTPHKMRIVKNTWISYNKANAIENDHLANLQIDDTLIDGSFGPISIDSGSKYSGQYEEENNKIIISNSLIGMLKLPGSETGATQSLDYTIWIKVRVPGPVPKIEIYDSIFATYGWDDHIPQSSRQENAWSHTVNCSNNIIAWLSDDPIPSHFPTPPSCFRITKGREARDTWNAAKQNWINCHPEVQHVIGDPAADPSQCDPNEFGGGQ